MTEPSAVGLVMDVGPLAVAVEDHEDHAAGNVTDPSHQVLQAAANGSRVGAMISFSLTDEDIRAVARPSANRADWDHRYGGEQMWSGSPNGSLVAEVDGLPPGRALDVELLHVDANALGAFEAGGCDLVSAQYASIPRTPDGVGVRNLLDAVASGGMLMVVSHDLEPMRTPIDTSTASRAFDPDGYVRVDDFVTALADDPAWVVVVHETRPRPAGAASSHHVDDVVLRARRAPAADARRLS